MLKNYNNGNAVVNIYEDGTRIIEYENNLCLDYPLNIDIRVSTECSFGQKPDGSYVLCDFCHESAKTNGKECDYEKLESIIFQLPKGIELAIGCNRMTDGLFNFLRNCTKMGYICNLTVNQGHLLRDKVLLMDAIEHGYVKGLGISFRSNIKWNVPKGIIEYPNTVFHVIAGIDSIESVRFLKTHGVRKILVLGEKNFGFNIGKVDLNTRKHKEWRWWIRDLMDVFNVVSFDNLALEQLKIKRFFSDEHWDIFNQGEHSFYINAVDGYFSPSSRSNNKTGWDIPIKEYFKSLNKN